MKTRILLSLVCVAAVSVVGCEKKGIRVASTTTKPAAPASAPVGTASISGKVKFLGKPIPPNVINVTDPGCNCEEVTEPGEKIAPDGGLADAIVYLDVPPTGDGAKQPTATLDQIKCNYAPHVLAVQTHQPVIIKSSDPTMHNVRYESANNGSRNLTMATAGETYPTQFSEPEFIKFRCDVHPWMSAYVGVFAHPYFAVTDDTGHFTIPNLPAGTYNLVVWHELLGTRRMSVQVGEAQKLEQTIQFDLQSNH